MFKELCFSHLTENYEHKNVLQRRITFTVMAEEDESGFSDIKSRLRNYSASKKSPSSHSQQKRNTTETSNTPKISEEKEDKMSQSETLSSSTVPDMTNAHLAELITNLTEKINTLQMDVTSLKSSKSGLDSFLKIAQEKTNLWQQVKDSQEDNDFRIKLLTATVIRQDQKIAELSKEIQSLKKQSPKANIIFDGILELPDEDKDISACKQLVKDFFKEQLEIDEDTDIPIRDIYRFGRANPRSMLVTLESSEHKELIFSNVAKLKGKTNARKKLFFIKNDMTEEDKELRSYFRELRTEDMDREDHDKIHVSLHKGKLFANNQLIKLKISMPEVADTLTLTQAELTSLKEVKLYEVSKHEEANSEFVCYFQRISHEADVQKALTKLKVKHGDATHIVTAYQLAHPRGPFQQGYMDDGEQGASRKILSVMKGKEVKKIAIFIVCFYGHQHLGKRRFEIYGALAIKATQLHKKKIDRLSRDAHKEHSASQSSQFSEFSQDEYHTTEDGDGE